MKRVGLAVGLLFLAVSAAHAADWPQYGADAARSGYSPEVFPGELACSWTCQAPHPPTPAWQGPDTRMPFDHAYHATVAEGTLFYGSSADHQVHALDAATGIERWTFFTDAPVRFAPAIFEGRVYVVSDDGHLYCLAAADGTLLWKKRGGPASDMLLGNDHMISRWPARGGVAIFDNTVYFAAGIWPSEGIYLYALDAATGATRWLNDAAGAIEMPQPHPTAVAVSGVSAQGYLAASEDYLFVPTGRAVPAVFNRKDGSLRYFHLQEYGQVGGASLVVAGAHFLNGGRIFDAATGAFGGIVPFPAVAVSAEHILCARQSSLRAIDRKKPVVDKKAVDRRGNPEIRHVLAEPAWSFEIPKSDHTVLIVVGQHAVYATKDGRIAAVDTATGQPVWRAQAEGVPLGLAFAEGRLYVSTDRGDIICFDAAGAGGGKTLAGQRAEAPYGENKLLAQAAKEIVNSGKVTEGYCLDLGCGDGGLAFELARRTDLRIYAADPDPEQVRTARQKLAAAGLYGTRVTVHCAEPEQAPYADYFADLIVSGRSVKNGTEAAAAAAAARMLRPYGGVSCFGRPGAFESAVRGPLEGAGEWTHQYAVPANTCASGDTLVEGPLRMLWFRDTDFEMPSRHGRGPAPLFKNGRIFVEGLNGLRAANAYNGRPLWEFALPGILTAYDQEHLVGTAGTGSNLCVEGDTLYVRQGARCLLLDVATGQQRGEFQAPSLDAGEPGVWGYLASADGMLFGSLSNTDHIVHWAYLESDMSRLFTESSLFFAINARTGAVQWTYEPEYSIRQNAIAIGGGRVYLIDRPLDRGDRLHTREAIARRRGEDPPKAGGTPVLRALHAATGEEVWSTRDDVYGTLLALDVADDVLLMTQQHTRFKLPSEKGGRMTAFRAAEGTRLWDAASDPRTEASRPLIINQVVYNEPGAWDLMTGERLDFQLARSYGCGIMSGCDKLLLYRSATLGYADPRSNGGTINYGGIRPGCWINAIPAGGIVLLPDATSRCRCSYLIASWAALQAAG